MYMGGYEAKERKNRGKVQIFLDGVFILQSIYLRITRRWAKSAGET